MFVNVRAVAIAALIAVFATPAVADDVSTFVKDGAAIGGTDPVAYFTESKPVAGSPEFTAEHDGVTWRFASAENRDAFAANPTKYVPAYGGYCATGTSFGKKIPIVPQHWKIVGGRLYLNSSDGAHKRFLSDEAGTITKADGNWPKIKTVPASQL